MTDDCLRINNLSVTFETDEGQVHAVNNVNLNIQTGEAIAVVGESGAGKSQIFHATMGLLGANATATGEIFYRTHPLLNQPQHFLNQFRGKKLSMVFQDPMTSLNPYLTVGKQLTEVLEIHQNMRRSHAKQQALEMLKAVQLPDAVQCFKQYPHELSGGMRQRVVIAMALLCQPDLLIADEPTTALDVTVQASIMQLLKSFHKQQQMALVLITHDLPLALEFCQRIVVMYAGSIVESGKTNEILDQPQHPYTQALLSALPQNDLNKQGRLETIQGTPPDPLQVSTGCSFQPRCQYADAACKAKPALKKINSTHELACFHPLECRT